MVSQKHQKCNLYVTTHKTYQRINNTRLIFANFFVIIYHISSNIMSLDYNKFIMK